MTDHRDAAAPTSLAELLHRGDLDGLVREVDRRSNAADWDGVLLLRDRCLAAAEELGKQLWGAAQYAEYRVALEAPAPTAAAVVLPGAARFALGPLTEVVAQTHTWAELADHLDATVAPVVAQERIVRGEDLSDDPRAGLDDVGLPGRLQPWEPRYALPTYRPAERLDGGPAPARAAPVELPAGAVPGRPTQLPELERALVDLVAPWERESSGEVHVATVEGDAAGAVAALVAGRARLVPLRLPEALVRMAWAGASGGARGRRRGTAAGRAAAWWVGHAATGLVFPAAPDDLEFHLEELTWYAFDEGGEDAGWRLRLVVEDHAAGWAAAVDAADRDDEDDDVAGDRRDDGREPRAL